MLATVIGLVLILSIFTAGVFAYVGMQRRTVASQVDIEQAFSVAEAGVERAAAYIEQHHGIVASTTFTNGSVIYGNSTQSNSYQAVIIPLSGYEFKIFSTGTVYRSTWNGSSMSVRRVIGINRVWLPSWAQYSLWSHENGAIYFTSGEFFSGKVHADDAMYFQGNPSFSNLVTSLATNFFGTTNAVTFREGFKLNTSAGTLANVPFDDLQSLAGTESNGVVFPSDTVINFSGTNYSVSTNSTYQYTYSTTNSRGRVTQHTGTRTNWYSAPLDNTKQLIYVEGDAYVAGTLDGRVTIVTDGAIHVTNNILYASDPSTNADSNDALGLISKNDVWVEPSCPTNMSLFAHIMATGYAGSPDGRGSFGAINYSTRSNGTLRMYGGIVQDLRAAVGLANGSHGYKKLYSFDTRFATNPPPFYPVQSETINYERWEEHAP